MPKTFKGQDGKDFEVDESEVVLISSELFRPKGKKDKETGEVAVTSDELTTVITMDGGRSYKRTSVGFGEVKRELGKGKI